MCILGGALRAEKGGPRDPFRCGCSCAFNLPRCSSSPRMRTWGFWVQASLPLPWALCPILSSYKRLSVVCLPDSFLCPPPPPRAEESFIFPPPAPHPLFSDGPDIALYGYLWGRLMAFLAVPDTVPGSIRKEMLHRPFSSAMRLTNQ